MYQSFAYRSFIKPYMKFDHGLIKSLPLSAAVAVSALGACRKYARAPS
jgi:hypothetical protein